MKKRKKLNVVAFLLQDAKQQKRKYCMDCIYASRDAHCYRRHRPCYDFDANDCPFYEESFFKYTSDESVKDERVGCCRLGSLLMRWLKGKTGRKHNNT